MMVYRLSKAKYKADLSGKGAEIAGGRWNNKGTALLYTSENRSLCTAEIAVHTELGKVPIGYYLVTIKIPDTTKIQSIQKEKLPRGWKSYPHITTTKTIGDRFAEAQKYLALKVPSAVITGEYNYLINPAHPEFPKVEIIKFEKFEFDKRMFT